MNDGEVFAACFAMLCLTIVATVWLLLRAKRNGDTDD